MTFIRSSVLRSFMFNGGSWRSSGQGALLAAWVAVSSAAWGQEAAPEVPPPDAPPPAAVLHEITARELKAHVAFLASDLLKGRDTATPESRLAAEYLAAQLLGHGATPGGDILEDGQASYLQKFPLARVAPDPETTTLEVIVETPAEEEGGQPVRKTATYRMGRDFQLLGVGTQTETRSGAVVFAGRPTEAAPAVDEAGVFVIRDPSAPSRRLQRQAEGADAPKPPLATLLYRGAGFDPSQGRVRSSLTLLEAERPADPTLILPESARELLGFDPNDTTPRALPQVQMTLNLGVTREDLFDHNVVGFFPGSDPERTREVIILSAHYDHIGVAPNGEVFNGADDNASGTAGLLEVLEALASGPRPARTVAFLWVSGEEKGLLGSRWFANHVSLPEGYEIVGNVNMDMISRNDPLAISLTPSDKHPSHNTIVAHAVAACQAEGIEARFDADQYFFRTDSANFARKGIPVVFFFCGIHPDYHRVSDDVDKGDFDKAAKVTRAVYRLVWSLANATDRPRVTAEAETKTDPNIGSTD
ncbi:peptidase M28 [Isosphaera pallida ATCC 43644]|uniref:Peptidase M28 n=1 Tax=Isosphaera pallida (strain ATCC 43644 / DSM 9630 / IS1B) TaxID=575540 RepID=E8R232_ISOPI|nr:M20/M25/M40 family metallo-hydrolase [Isosphaera pallida]ADV62464.1 peptidase M28 [Isosphaera pallida ATCC 43644]